MYTKIIRNNKEVEFITNNKNYDSEYQNYNWLTKPIVLQKVKLKIIRLQFKREINVIINYYLGR
jgi:hypothetical protein